jgi:hypothetical protein
MGKMNQNRRDFLKKGALITTGLGTLGAMGFSAKSYGNIIGANDRINVAIIGLGRRLGAFIPPLTHQDTNVHVSYLCDVMKFQRENAGKIFSEKLPYNPKLENSFFKVIDDKEVDAIINATPDHWHAPGSWLALEAGKHVYVEKPCSHNPREGEVLVAYQKKYGKIVQMGNQQRSSDHTIEIIREIHQGAIGTPYLANAFYSSNTSLKKHEMIDMLLEKVKDENYKLQDYTDKQIKRWMKRLPLIIDKSNFRNNWALADDYYVIHRQTLFQIVNETIVDNYENTSLFYSEKTFRPIVCFQPFVIYGQKGCNQYLKKIGYKTYVEWFYLSFDTEEDNILRYKKLLSSIKETCKYLDNLSREHQIEWRFKNKKLLQHNFEVMTKSEWSMNKLIKFLEKVDDQINNNAT